MKNYDLVIIGGGPAGLAAGLYAARAKMAVILLEKMMPGGQAFSTEHIENYPGFPEGVAGPELTSKMEDQAKRFGLEIVSAEVQDLIPGDKEHQIITASEKYTARAVIIASGAEPSKLQVPGESEFHGRGVSYCATCDGAFYRDREVVVIGGGDAAVEEAIYLTKFAKKVSIVHRRDSFRATRVLQERAFSNEKINVIWNTQLQGIYGKDTVEYVTLQNKTNGETTDLPTNGVFMYVGTKPANEYLKGLVKVDERGYIITDENMATNVPGIFAAGDVRKKLLRQVITAVADGAIAAVAAEKIIDGH